MHGRTKVAVTLRGRHAPRDELNASRELQSLLASICVMRGIHHAACDDYFGGTKKGRRDYSGRPFEQASRFATRRYGFLYLCSVWHVLHEP